MSESGGSSGEFHRRASGVVANGGVDIVELSFRAGWKRLGIFILLTALVFWTGSHVVAQVRGLRMANIVDDPRQWQAALLEDPDQTDLHTQLGYHYLNDPAHPDASLATGHFESAVRAHPYDYRAWTELGYAYDRQGRLDSAARAYMTGVSLAPDYAYPRWWWGNFLIRQGRVEQAYQEFSRLAEVEPDSIADICRVIWHTSGQDGAKLAAFGVRVRSGEAKAGVCRSLAIRGEPHRAAEVWDTLDRIDPARAETGHRLVSMFCGMAEWSLAYRVWRELITEEFGGEAGVSVPDLLLWNGGFEHDPPPGRGFDWSIAGTPQVEARIDTEERSQGSRSLLLEFKQHRKVSIAVPHYLWVEPGTRYSLRFEYKTANVPAVNGLAVVLSDAGSPERFTVETEPLGNPEPWTRREIQFESPAKARVLKLEIVRRPVGVHYDYVKGRAWFDAFHLEASKAAGPIPSRSVQTADLPR